MGFKPLQHVEEEQCPSPSLEPHSGHGSDGSQGLAAGLLSAVGDRQQHVDLQDSVGQRR